MRPVLNFYFNVDNTTRAAIDNKVRVNFAQVSNRNKWDRKRMASFAHCASVQILFKQYLDQFMKK